MPLKRTILVADCDKQVRLLLARELGTAYEVLAAKDGLEAINIYEQNAERVVAVVADLKMPRLGGQLVTEWLHHIRPQLPVIVTGSDITASELEDLLQSPFVSFLVKPFEVKQLASILDILMEEKQDEAA